MMITGIVLAAGSGKRMHSSQQKQFMQLKDKPLIYYALKAFQESKADKIILVTNENSIEYCRSQIAERYGLDKIKAIVAGGSERYHSVYSGLLAAAGSDYVLIHDGARPLVSPEMINILIEEVQLKKACISGMPVKDTIKITDRNGYVESTPERDRLWSVHTPQAFDYHLILRAHEAFRREGCPPGITDDGMMVENYTDCPVKMVEGTYANLKVTTPEDLLLAEILLSKRN